MQPIQSSALKAILHSKRANIYYLEYCRVMQKDGRVLYLTESDKENLYYNIPIANTTCLLLGTGTSITQAAMRMLAQAGVLVGFSGGGGTPLLMASEIEWLTPQSEYRPTEYVQGWLSWWFDDNKRLDVAKNLQIARLDFLNATWSKDKDLRLYGFDSNNDHIKNLISTYKEKILQQTSIMNLLQLEARLTKELYKLASKNTHYNGFSRDHDGLDKANIFLNHGNYLAYGLGATTAWVLGIPHGFAVMHGKTRRGALVFDIADIVKDALILPKAFICASENATEQDFRQECLNTFTQHKALDVMFNTIKTLALKTDWEE
ncbi:type I-F CRISPR-associated endonuclease Cas1f [Pasteurella skyensis]|uniref:CRISPR-associated endonuclease Cas1 n=3 Tax=Pasteurellaceae TaxID=712 RepID=A0AAJ6NAF1_9PAST|nr:MULTISPECIES: type I-F CRISPR-associated endonuclease Cas1f [Pasteurella]MDP8051655.1 type I-F CRISPR-associated endonuclease Cas1f [Pasteurella atlantica]MDP8100940.1 type I-F CRISPR-associated endonuclease Cas1f [Pasteurella atlantica]MDP8105022.1 type I-F CRISPR-associated endonuclease Cas1f [Pasteurella atlantica]MDP8148313.1 type I-F CRISPR-associated endonuclease Cas1f [Pasteurella atlantica]MDP8163016.1 type I-F CRISPR-associated endonuclease Cas1f [Pasteurella skyensis]